MVTGDEKRIVSTIMWRVKDHGDTATSRKQPEGGTASEDHPPRWDFKGIYTSCYRHVKQLIQPYTACG